MWQINSGCLGQSGVGVVTRGCRLSALVGFARPRDGPGRGQPPTGCAQASTHRASLQLHGSDRELFPVGPREGAIGFEVGVFSGWRGCHFRRLA